MIRQYFGDNKNKNVLRLRNSNVKCLKKLKLKKRFIFFGQNSGIHGLRHLFANGAFIINRLFWLLIVLASAGCLYLLLLSDERDDLNFTPDSLYLTWTTTFPAVTVCETYSGRAVQKKLLEKYPNYTQHLSLDFRKYIAAVMYGRGSCSKSICVPCGDKVPCDLPIREIFDNIRLKCTELLSNCSFNGMEFPCCDKFHIVDSEYGPCYSFNTLQSENSDLESLFRVNRSTGPGRLDFRISGDSEVAVHSPEELATLDLDPKFKFEVKLYLENRVEYFFSVVEIENDKVLAREDMNVRRCRYLDELPNDFYKYPVYGYGACQLSHSTEHVFEHCQCIHPIRLKTYEHLFCNFTGIHCVVIHEFEKSKLGVDSKPMADDNCLPSCVESELTTVHVSRKWVQAAEPTKGASITIQMIALPTLRFQRNLVTSNLDIVVNVGGMFSLFFGASIFSFVEIFYLIFRKQ